MNLRLATIVALGIPSLACGPVPPERPVIQSGEPAISYRIGDEWHRGTWVLDPELRPDVLVVDLDADQTVEVCFVTDRDELCRVTAIGDTHDLDVVYDGVVHQTRIEGRRRVPAAVFNAEYIAANRGKITPVIPEVYELVNVAVALTEVGRTDRWLVYKQSEYYERVMERFADHLQHPFVLALNEQMEQNRSRYGRLKMNGYAFVYDERGEIQRSPIYDRTGFAGDRDNALLPLLEEMRAFSRDTDFRSFYERERPTYDEQIRFYVETVDLQGMNRWLGRQFPGVAAYDTVRIVFSPLVGGSQSSTWFEHDGFRELQPHVNFPYRRLKGVSPAGQAVYCGNIVFTELNHGYINPTADGYAERIETAIEDLAFWGDDRVRRSYGSPMATFNEYMNWGLVALYAIDRAPAQDRERLLSDLDRFMGEDGRGFLRFSAFRAFLVDRYVGRGEGETVADLYPAIIEWFAERGTRP